jgi:hypothetical protein
MGGPTQAKGTLDINLAEALFDGDFPSHYNRKIKTVSLTFLGARMGGGKSINATLVQTTNSVVVTPDPDAVGHLVKKHPQNPPVTIRTNWLPNQAVALSRRENDAGLFVLDLLYPDDQFYPFEGTGAVSKWRLTVPPINNRIDFNAISDIVMKLRYTSKDGGPDFGKTVMGLYTEPAYPLPLARLVDVKAELGQEQWGTFVSTPVGGIYSFHLPLADGVFIANKADVKLVSADILLQTTAAISDVDESTQFVTLTVGGGDAQSVKIANRFGTADLQGRAPTEDRITLDLKLPKLPAGLKRGDNLDPDALKNIFLAVRFNSNGL